MVLFLMVLTFLAAEIGWLVLKPLRPHLRVIAYLVCTAGILFVGSWLTGIAYERTIENQPERMLHPSLKISDARASNIISGTALQVATGTLALLCISWGTRALRRSRALWPLALVLYFLALPLAFLSFLAMFGANNW